MERFLVRDSVSDKNELKRFPNKYQTELFESKIDLVTQTDTLYVSNLRWKSHSWKKIMYLLKLKEKINLIFKKFCGIYNEILEG